MNNNLIQNLKELARNFDFHVRGGGEHIHIKVCPVCKGERGFVRYETSPIRYLCVSCGNTFTEEYETKLEIVRG